MSSLGATKDEVKTHMVAIAILAEAIQVAKRMGLRLDEPNSRNKFILFFIAYALDKTMWDSYSRTFFMFKMYESSKTNADLYDSKTDTKVSTNNNSFYNRTDKYFKTKPISYPDIANYIDALAYNSFIMNYLNKYVNSSQKIVKHKQTILNAALLMLNPTDTSQIPEEIKKLKIPKKLSIAALFEK